MPDMTTEQAAEALRLKREDNWQWRDIAAMVGYDGSPGEIFLAAAMAARAPVSRQMLNRLDQDVRDLAVKWNAKVRREVRAGQVGSLEPLPELEAPGSPAQPMPKVPMVVRVQRKRGKRR